MENRDKNLQLGISIAPYFKSEEIDEIIQDYNDLEITDAPIRVAEALRQEEHKKLPRQIVVFSSIIVLVLIARALYVTATSGTYGDYIWFFVVNSNNWILYQILFNLLIPITMIALWNTFSGSGLIKANLSSGRSMKTGLIPSIIIFILPIPLLLFFYTILYRFEEVWSGILVLSDVGPLVMNYFKLLVAIVIILSIWGGYRIVKKGEIERFGAMIVQITIIFYTVSVILTMKELSDLGRIWVLMGLAHIPIVVGIIIQILFYYYIKSLSKKVGT